MVHTCIRALRIWTLYYCAIVLLPYCPIHYVLLLLHIMVHHEQNKKKRLWLTWTSFYHASAEELPDPNLLMPCFGYSVADFVN